MPVLGAQTTLPQPSSLASGVTVPGLFQPELSLYLPTGCLGLPNAAAALARARNGGAPLRITCIGDSITRGAIGGAADYVGQSYPGRLRSILTRYGTAVEGVVFAIDGTDSRVTLGSGWSVASAFGVANWTGTSPAGALVVTPTTSGTVVRVQYARRTIDSTTVSVSIDGGAASTFSTNVTSPSVDSAYFTVTGLTNTTHSVSITATGGSVWIMGVSVEPAASGCIVTRAGVDGITSSTMTTQPTSKVTPFGSFVGLGAGVGWTPDLIVLNLGTNDAFFNNVTPSTTTANLVGAVSAAASSACDVLLVAPSLYDTTVGSPQRSWIKAVYDAADTSLAPLVDIGNRWGTYAVAKTRGHFGADHEHPTALGYTDMAEAVDRVLSVLL